MKEMYRLMVVFFLLLSCTVFADRELNRTEILELFQELTNQPQKTWVPAGTIEATREEYRAAATTDQGQIDAKISQEIASYLAQPNKSERTEALQKMTLDAMPFNVRYESANEYTMNSTVIVKFDGERFYWEINVDSRTDSVKPGKELAGNYMTNEFNLNWNTRRIFAWDGTEYTTYSPSGNHAMIDCTPYVSHNVNGPLTAGYIPWGYGYYSYDSLAATNSTAIEKIIDGKTQVHLTLNVSSDMQIDFVIDPEKNNALLSCSIEEGDKVIFREYSDYQMVSGNWVPLTILLEKYEVETNRLLARDIWNITSINGDSPGIESFAVELEEDALVEYVSPITDKPALYRYTVLADTDALLGDRLEYAANEGVLEQNCATAALKYASSKLGVDIAESNLAGLVNGENRESSLSSVKQLAEAQGLYCKAVTADIDTLKDLENCQVILHIPGKNHFVVLDSIDNNFVRIIDLSNDKFYYRTDVNFFGMDWSEGTALLISNNAISGDFIEIESSDLANIIGASGYTCTLLLQEEGGDYCTIFQSACTPYVTEYYERYGCEAAGSGSCSSDWMYRMRYSPCVKDPYYPESCKDTGEWAFTYMLACA